MNDVYIIGGLRSYIGVYNGMYRHVPAEKLGAAVLQEVIRAYGLVRIDEIIGGNSVGCGGNGKMQPQYAEMLAKCDVEAMIFDCFSNPTAQLIEERTIPFIRTIRKAHPDIPLIFISTAYREARNFNTRLEASEQAKAEMAAKMMKQAISEFDDVYYITPKTLTGYDHDTSVDGTQPSDMGYQR